jgi:hypothetical protein
MIFYNFFDSHSRLLESRHSSRNLRHPPGPQFNHKEGPRFWTTGRYHTRNHIVSRSLHEVFVPLFVVRACHLSLVLISPTNLLIDMAAFCCGWIVLNGRQERTHV